MADAETAFRHTLEQMDDRRPLSICRCAAEEAGLTDSLDESTSNGRLHLPPTGDTAAAQSSLRWQCLISSAPTLQAHLHLFRNLLCRPSCQRLFSRYTAFSQATFFISGHTALQEFLDFALWFAFVRSHGGFLPESLDTLPDQSHQDDPLPPPGHRQVHISYLSLHWVIFECGWECGWPRMRAIDPQGLFGRCPYSRYDPLDTPGLPCLQVS